MTVSRSSFVNKYRRPRNQRIAADGAVQDIIATIPYKLLSRLFPWRSH
jgi:hypothetical protein